MFRMHLKGYDVIAANAPQAVKEFIETKQYSQIAVLMDENTRRHCLHVVEGALGGYHPIIIPSGEQHKTLETCQLVWSKMLQYGLDRHSLLVNLGGGVIGDLGGFCAATYLRGIDFIQIPTTLLSMTDSSIGGKLGVDFHFGKNIIGVFKNPVAVFINPVFLNTLPDNELRSGFAEIIKHSLIADAQLWEHLQIISDLRQVDWLKLLPLSLEVKKHIVEVDPHEKKERKALNFGHTVGHAVESFALQSGRPLLHGEAVALGIVCESYLSHQLIGLSIENLKAITQFIHRFYPPYRVDETDFHELLSWMKRDKKNLSGRINFTLLQSIGKAVVDQECGEKLIAESLQYYLRSF